MSRLIILALFILGHQAIFAQPSSVPGGDSKNLEPITAPQQQFYLPSKLYSDSLTLYKAIPFLAESIMKKTELEKRASSATDKFKYYDTAVHYALAMQHYNEAIRLVDSIRKYNEFDPGNPAFELPFESWAIAKRDDRSGDFKATYMNSFKTVYNKLPGFREKILTNFLFDSAQMISDEKSFSKIVSQLKNKNSDSINLKDAQGLIFKYVDHEVSSVTVPLARPFINASSAHVLYPVIRTAGAGVIPINNITEPIDKELKYNLLMELSDGIKNKNDSDHINSINDAFAEVARKINIHIAAGIPKENLNVVMVFHGRVLNSLLNNDAFRKKYNVNNPNIVLLQDLQKAGVKMIACGQAMFGFNVKVEDMIPGVKVALSAQSVLSTYQLKHYMLYDLGSKE